MLDLLLTLPPATSLPFASVHCATRKAQAKENAQRQRGKEARRQGGMASAWCIWNCLLAVWLAAKELLDGAEEGEEGECVG